MAARDLRLLPQFKCHRCGQVVQAYYPPRWHERPSRTSAGVITADSPLQDPWRELWCAQCWRRR